VSFHCPVAGSASPAGRTRTADLLRYRAACSYGIQQPSLWFLARVRRAQSISESSAISCSPSFALGGICSSFIVVLHGLEQPTVVGLAERDDRSPSPPASIPARLSRLQPPFSPSHGTKSSSLLREAESSARKNSSPALSTSAAATPFKQRRRPIARQEHEEMPEARHRGERVSVQAGVSVAPFHGNRKAGHESIVNDGLSLSACYSRKNCRTPSPPA